jgi:hypothetical protein
MNKNVKSAMLCSSSATSDVLAYFVVTLPMFEALLAREAISKDLDANSSSSHESKD